MGTASNQIKGLGHPTMGTTLMKPSLGNIFICPYPWIEDHIIGLFILIFGQTPFFNEYGFMFLLIFVQIKREIATMKLIKHPNVVQLYEVFIFPSFCSMPTYV